MGWGRIDDEFDEHPKILAVLDEHDAPEAALAIALWTLCFTWAHRNTRRRGKVPGLIPAGLPRRYFGGSARTGIEVLIKHRLWDLTDGGWLIHDFADYLPTEKTREERAAAGRKGAAKRWHKDDNAEATPSQTDSKLPSEDGSLLQDDDKAMASDGSRAPAHRDPIPVPVTQTQRAEDQTLFPIEPSADGGERPNPAKLPDAHRFDEFWEAYPHKRDKDAGRKAWAKVVRDSQKPNADWTLDDVIAGAGFYRFSKEFVGGFAKYPATFLNKGSWRDFASGPPPEIQPPVSGGFDARAAEFDQMRDRQRSRNAAADGAAALIRTDRSALTRGDADA